MCVSSVKTRWSLAVGVLVAALSASVVLSGLAEKYLDLAVHVEKDTFKVDEPIAMELRINYEGSETLTLRFASSQRYDFEIETESGEVVWRWSEGRMFAQILGQITLSPDRPEVRYHAVFRDHLSPGRYKLRGILTVQPQSRSSEVQITVQ